MFVKSLQIAHGYAQMFPPVQIRKPKAVLNRTAFGSFMPVLVYRLTKNHTFSYHYIRF